MKLPTVLTVGILIVFLSGSCKKENEIKGIVSFSGITELEVSGMNIGNIDTTDWKFTDNWKPYEENLFKSNNPNHNSVTEQIRPDPSILVVGYPNPATDGLIALLFQLGTNMYYDLRIIDEHLIIMCQFDSVDYNSLYIKDSIYISNKLYRAYYKVYSDNKVYRGHGDFKFIK